MSEFSCRDLLRVKKAAWTHCGMKNSFSSCKIKTQLDAQVSIAFVCKPVHEITSANWFVFHRAYTIRMRYAKSGRCISTNFDEATILMCVKKQQLMNSFAGYLGRTNTRSYYPVRHYREQLDQQQHIRKAEYMILPFVTHITNHAIIQL